MFGILLEGKNMSYNQRNMVHGKEDHSALAVLS